MSRLGIKPGPLRWEVSTLAKSYSSSILLVTVFVTSEHARFHSFLVSGFISVVPDPSFSMGTSYQYCTVPYCIGFVLCNSERRIQYFECIILLKVVKAVGILLNSILLFNLHFRLRRVFNLKFAYIYALATVLLPNDPLSFSQCCGSMTFWYRSGSGSADPCL
jgi:hypothetical protein